MSRSGGAEHETDCAEKEKEKNEPPFKGEYRTFYLSPFELGHEEKMLAVYQAEDLDDLLLSTCIMLESQSQLLMRIQPDEQIPTFYVKEWGTLAVSYTHLATWWSCSWARGRGLGSRKA